MKVKNASAGLRCALPRFLRASILCASILYAPMLYAQGQQQTPPPFGPFGGNQARGGLPEQMTATYKQQIEALKADIGKLNASLVQLKTNVAAIQDPAEKARWQANVDMWETIVSHMDAMAKQMEAMGPGPSRAPGPGFPPPLPGTEQRQQ